MSAFNFRLFSHNRIENNTALKEIQKNYTNWEGWYKRLTDLNFGDEMAKAYATIFINNGSNFSMIHDLDNDTLKAMGVNKAEHRMQILRMKPSLPIFATRSATIIEHCSQHLDTTATDKCHRCKRHVCIDCREQLTLGPSIITYCEKCADSVSCTIQ